MLACIATCNLPPLPAAMVLSGNCEYLVVFLVLLFLEIGENVVVSTSEVLRPHGYRERFYIVVRVKTKGFYRIKK